LGQHNGITEMSAGIGVRTWILLAALSYWMANAALHLVFSNLLTRSWLTPVGELVPIRYSRELVLASTLILLAWICWRGVLARRRYLSWVAWLLLLTAMAASNRWLLTTPVESIHYLQYAIITAMFALALDSERQHWPALEVLLLVFWLSVLDEAYQYLHLTARQGTYFDFNDLLLNHLGALAGLLGYYGFCERPPRACGRPALRRALVAFSLAVMLAIAAAVWAEMLALQTDRPVPPGGFHPEDASWRLYMQRESGLYASWQPTFSQGEYYVLSPLQAMALLLLTGLPVILGGVSLPRSGRGVAAWRP
jgi:hypothetical protein